jgi:hypothetical protein
MGLKNRARGPRSGLGKPNQREPNYGWLWKLTPREQWESWCAAQAQRFMVDAARQRAVVLGQRFR